MTIDRGVLRRGLREAGIFLLVSIVQTYFSCNDCDTAIYFIVWSYIFLMWILLWKGNDFLAHQASRRFSWLHSPFKRLVVGIVTTIVYTLLVMLVMMKFYEQVIGLNFGRRFMSTLYVTMGFTFLVSLILHSHDFLKRWKQASLDREKFEKESVTAKYESLKNQVNPHFLFNSLNALTNLVYEDQDKAAKFIKQLSEVYRYVLDTRDKEVVPLEEEMKFLQSYLFLQKIRFGDKLDVQLSLNGTVTSVAPLALQMLIENAIKHNIVSEDDPLRIRVFPENGYITVENNLQRKGALGEPSSGVGLENICKRYEFLSDRKVEIMEDDRTFKVRIPMLTGNLL
jgi:sensor histidine kinase YesM